MSSVEPDPNETAEPESSDDAGPEIMDLPDGADREVPDELRRTFWKLVLLFNVGIFALSLGVLLVVFESRFLIGGGAVVVGAVALVQGFRGYRVARKE